MRAGLVGTTILLAFASCAPAPSLKETNPIPSSAAPGTTIPLERCVRGRPAGRTLGDGQRPLSAELVQGVPRVFARGTATRWLDGTVVSGHLMLVGSTTQLDGRGNLVITNPGVVLKYAQRLDRTNLPPGGPKGWLEITNLEMPRGWGDSRHPSPSLLTSHTVSSVGATEQVAGSLALRDYKLCFGKVEGVSPDSGELARAVIDLQVARIRATQTAASGRATQEARGIGATARAEAASQVPNRPTRTSTRVSTVTATRSSTPSPQARESQASQSGVVDSVRSHPWGAAILKGLEATYKAGGDWLRREADKAWSSELMRFVVAGVLLYVVGRYIFNLKRRQSS